MSTWRNIMNASRVAVKAFQLSLSEPFEQHLEYDVKTTAYDMLWQYYRNEAYADLQAWSAYMRYRGMYKKTTNLYNPVRRLVDFYSGIVYPGMLTPDGQPHDDGTPSAIPFDEDMDAGLVSAIAQIFQWSNWSINNHVMVRYGAALGSTLIEVRDDIEKGRIQFAVVWPGFVTELTLDDFGNVKSYTIEYKAYDEESDTEYEYKRMVDGNYISTYRDDQPFAYNDDPQEWENPYGFAPAVWVKHSDNGTDQGGPAVRAISKIDYLNSLASHAWDQVHKVVGAPVVIAGDNVHSVGDSPNPEITPQAEPDTIDIVHGAQGTQVHTLYLPPGESINHINAMLEEIERDHPELSMYQQMRNMERVSGPGADRMFGDVAGYVAEARSAYDSATTNLCQMGVAIGGYRVNGGGWPSPTTAQQEKFSDYSLESWEDDDLGIGIMPRNLFQPSEYERIQTELAKLQLRQAENSLQQFGMGQEDMGARIQQIASNRTAALGNSGTGQQDGTEAVAVGTVVANG